MHERLAELRELQDRITAARRDELIGSVVEVLVDAPGQGRTYREAPEIDGIVTVPDDLPVGAFVEVRVVDALGPDLVAEALAPAPPEPGRDRPQRPGTCPTTPCPGARRRSPSEGWCR